MRPQFLGKPIKTNKDYGKACIKLEVLGLPRIDGGGRSVSVRRAERVAERLPVVDAICLTKGGGRGVCRGGVASGQRTFYGVGGGKRMKAYEGRNGLRPRLDVPDIPGAMRSRGRNKNAIVERIR